MRRLNPALFATSLLLLLASLLPGPADLSLPEILGGLFGWGEEEHGLIVREIRLPRSLAAFVTGAALALAGATLQGLLRNPLAEPGVLGVTATAILGATTALYFGFAAPLFAVPASASVGALSATLLISLAAVSIRRTATLILFGIGLSSFVGALMSVLLTLAPTPFTLMEMVNWSFGSVANRSLRDLAFALPFLAAGAALCAASARGLTFLALGEEAAAVSGLDIRRHRLLAVGGAGLLTGGAVALAGGIGFVGIVAPHIVRPLTGHDPGRSLLPSALLGGCLLLLADLLLRTLPAFGALRLGVAASLIGAPVFIWIALQEGRQR
jgi:iron complex transport system permease protein